MKRMLYLIPVFAVILLLSSCSSKTPAIEDYEWKMRTVMSAGAPELVVAVGEPDSVHPEAQVVDMTLKAENGVITISNNTNGTTATGTYRVTGVTPEGTEYEIIIDGETANACVAPTKYYDGSEMPTLPISVDGFSLYFIPVNY